MLRHIHIICVAFRVAAYIQITYLLWVSFASALNHALIQLNH
ncbi:MAG: tryptophan-rich sensory protein [Sediminibacterium magnilacihabitans]|nr:tryptophan-rich sensory protein [Sediminibacterium magnilacihabitans]